MKTLATFGDSWPDASNVDRSYGRIIAEDKFQYNFQNCAEPATSIHHMILQLNEYVLQSSAEQLSNTTAIFFITHYERQLFIDDNGNQIELIPGAAGIDESSTSYFNSGLFSENNSIFRAQSSLLTLQKICNEYKINDLYVFGWEKFPTDFVGNSKEKFHNMSCLEMLNILPIDFYEFTAITDYFDDIKDDRHPNQLGHQKIADDLTPWIKMMDKLNG